MDLIDRQMVIDTEGLDEQIRCEMCRNPMHTDRGCDGNCKYDEKLYERIMQILGERIKPLSSAQPESSTDIQDVLGYLDDVLHPLVSPDNWNVYSELYDMISRLPSAQPEIIHCEECAYRKDNFMGDWCTCWCGWTSLDGHCHKGANKDE